MSEYPRVQVLTSIAGIASLRRRHPRVLIPTMGSLHKGHIELIRIARGWAGAKGEVVVSIFVNPLQFEPGTDFEKYPRPEEADERICRDEGVDLLFRPDAAEIYFPDRSVVVEETGLSETLCGKSRPGHFRGVCTVLAKLFHIVSPDAAVFGEKDFQQLAIVRRMVRDLNFTIDVIAVATVREADGLALSSRNQYLNAEERKQASVLHESLKTAERMFRAGETSVAKIVFEVRRQIEEAPLARIDYVEFVDAQTLQPLERTQENSLVALAVFFGKTRLIDNIRLA